MSITVRGPGFTVRIFRPIVRIPLPDRRPDERKPPGIPPGRPRMKPDGGRAAYWRTWMFFFAQISFSAFGQIVTLISPRCALRSRSMSVLDCPIPPPIESGI